MTSGGVGTAGGMYFRWFLLVGMVENADVFGWVTRLSDSDDMLEEIYEFVPGSRLVFKRETMDPFSG